MIHIYTFDLIVKSRLKLYWFSEDNWVCSAGWPFGNTRYLLPFPVMICARQIKYALYNHTLVKSITYLDGMIYHSRVTFLLAADKSLYSLGISDVLIRCIKKHLFFELHIIRPRVSGYLLRERALRERLSLNHSFTMKKKKKIEMSVLHTVLKFQLWSVLLNAFGY